MSAAEKLWGRVFAEKKPAPVDPLRAFERVLQERERLYDELRALTLELIYRRQRASAEIHGWRFEVARLHAAEREAERAGRRSEAEILSEERRRLASDIRDADDALLESGREVDEAKRRLGELAQEIARLGFTKCIMPYHARGAVKAPEGLELLPVRSIGEAVGAALKK